LAGITGIDGLITDPGLSGGNFCTSSLTSTRSQSSRIAWSLITNLNKDWLPAYGGALELWNAEEEKCEVEVLPVFGRSVLFAHSSKSLHGYPTKPRAEALDIEKRAYLYGRTPTAELMQGAADAKGQ